MRLISLTLLLSLWMAVLNGQTTIEYKNIIQDKTQAARYQQEISSMTNLLAKMFLAKANNKKEKVHTQIQDFFADYKLNEQNVKQYDYPALLNKTNLSISVTGFDSNWGLLPNADDTTMSDGYRNKTLEAIVSVPVFESYHRGYALSAITFYCTLNETVTWTEPRNNTMPVENLPGYKKEESLKIKVMEPEK